MSVSLAVAGTPQAFTGFVDEADAKRSIALVLGVFGAILLALSGITANPALLVWTAVHVAVASHMFLTGRESIPAMLWALALAGFVKRTLFSFGSVDRVEYLLAVALPDLLLLSCAGVILVRLLREPRRPLAAADVGVMILFAYMFFSVFNPAGNPLVGMAGFKLTAIPVIAYLAGRATRWTPGTVAGLRRAILGIVVVASVLGILQTWVFPLQMDRAWMESGHTGLVERYLRAGSGFRIYSVFESHEQLGFFLAFGFLCLVSTGIRAPHLLLGGAILAAVFLTYSRSSWAALAVGLACLVVIRNRRELLLPAGMLLPAAALLASGTWAAAISILDFGQVSPVFEKAVATGSFHARVVGWSNFWSDSGYWTVFGNGIGSMWAASSKFQGARIVPHNGILQFVFELGWAGTFLFGAVWILLLREVVRAPSRLTGGLVLAAVCYQTGVMVSNAAVNEVMMLRQVTVPFWLMAGFMVARCRTEGTR